MARKPKELIPDPRDGPRHPSRQTGLIGHDDVQSRLLRAYGSGKFHHAWLLTGAKGIGKATLAYRFARFVLANPQPEAACRLASLDVDPQHPVFPLVASRGHPDLLVVEPPFDQKADKVRDLIPADEARRPSEFFAKTAGAGGWRVCIVDAADDLQKTGANALLKILEEPPARAMFLLVCHAPSKLLPTIRSRCAQLPLRSLGNADVSQVLTTIGAEHDDIDAIVSLANGSPGRALQLLDNDGAKQFMSFCSIFKRPSSVDHLKLMQIADKLNGRNQTDGYTIFCDLLGDWLYAAARASALETGAAACVVSRHWADLAADIGHSIRQANALNLDRRQMLLDAFAKIEVAAKQPA